MFTCYNLQKKKMENYTIKTNIIRFYLLPNSSAMKICNQKYAHEEHPKIRNNGILFPVTESGNK